MQLYDKATWQLMREMVENLGLAKGEVLTKQRVLQWFEKNYPKIKQSTITAHLTRMSTNTQTRVYYGAKPESDDLFFKIDGSHFRLYDRSVDPPPIYGDVKKKNISDKEKRAKQPQSLEDKILDLVQVYSAEWQNKLKHAENQLSEVREENQKLRKALEKTPSIIDEIRDKALLDRVRRLGTPPLDTLIRESGVVLEDRLRAVAPDKKDEHGVKLVETIFDFGKGCLQVSEHPGEQEGVRMLYRGAIQFIRNPPMHKLIDYREDTARILIRLIDSLLSLLEELKQSGEIKIEVIKLMLQRAPIIDSQRNLYKALYEAGDSGLTNFELAKKLNINRRELSGVLGSLGRRINQTKGIENKGGIGVVFEIKQISDSIWHYRMRPILRKALEEEGLV